VEFDRIIRNLAFALVFCLGLSGEAFTQIHRVGAGLAFASGYDYNLVPVGNPGFRVKTWLRLDKGSVLHLVPSLTAFNPNVYEARDYTISNFLFMGDLDGQVTIYGDKTLKIIAFAGGNVSYLNSVVRQGDPVFDIAEDAPGSASDLVLGANLGGGLELIMGYRWDMNVCAKYILSDYSQLVLSVEGVYYFEKRRRQRR
jgi:hypothetical protein